MAKTWQLAHKSSFSLLSPLIIFFNCTFRLTNCTNCDCTLKYTRAPCVEVKSIQYDETTAMQYNTVSASSFHISSFYLAQNYFINPASNSSNLSSNTSCQFGL